MVIANALYFKGVWSNPFNNESTTIKCFQTPKKDCINVEMMQNVDHYKYNYIHDLQSHVVDLPYEVSNSIILTFVINFLILGWKIRHAASHSQIKIWSKNFT